MAASFLDEQGNSLEAKHAARAALHALAARQAMAVEDRLPAPGMVANVDAHGTVVGAAAALNTSLRIRHDLSLGKHFMPRGEDVLGRKRNGRRRRRSGCREQVLPSTGGDPLLRAHFEDHV